MKIEIGMIKEILEVYDMNEFVSVFSKIIDILPEADIPFQGIKGRILQGESSQLVFMEIEPIGEVPPHTHGAQWGVVIEGEMELTIDGKTRTCRKGDHYFIAAGVVHSALFNSKVFVIDYFEDRDRYAVTK